MYIVFVPYTKLAKAKLVNVLKLVILKVKLT